MGVPEAAIEAHEELAVWALWLIALSTLLAWATHVSRRGMWVAAIVSLGAMVVIALAAYRGGRLVYIHGAGRVPAANAPASAPATRSEERRVGKECRL